MSLPVNRPDLVDTVADVKQRVRILEADPGCCGPGSGGLPPPFGFPPLGDCGGYLWQWSAPFSVNTSGNTIIGRSDDDDPDLVVDYSLFPDCDLWVAALFFDLDGMPITPGGYAQIVIRDDFGLHDVTSPFIIPNGSGQANSFIPWTLLCPAGAHTGEVRPLEAVLLISTPGPGDRSGNLIVQTAWFPTGSTVFSPGIVAPGTNPGDILYWDGATWVPLAIGSPGDVLTVSADNLPEWA